MKETSNRIPFVPSLPPQGELQLQSDKDLLLELYARIVRIRKFELRVIEIFAARMKTGDFPGALHTCDGEEAVAVGVCSLLRRDDYVFSTHRGHRHALASRSTAGDSEKNFAQYRVIGEQRGIVRWWILKKT